MGGWDAVAEKDADQENTGWWCFLAKMSSILGEDLRFIPVEGDLQKPDPLPAHAHVVQGGTCLSQRPLGGGAWEVKERCGAGEAVLWLNGEHGAV